MTMSADARAWTSRRRRAWLPMLALVLAMARPAAGQGGANVGGVVTDDTGAALPGVTVTVTNTSNGATQVLVTGPEGNYRAVNLQPGAVRRCGGADGLRARQERRSR